MKSGKSLEKIIYELWLDVEEYVSFNKVPKKDNDILCSDRETYDYFRQWYKQNRIRFNNDWDVYSIVRRFFKNKYYIPKQPPWKK